MSTALTTPEKRKPGARPGSAHALRHGLRSARGPKGTKYIDAYADTYRLKLEQAVLAIHGVIGPYEAGVIQTARQAFVHAMRAERWLRLRFDQLNDDQRLAFSRESVKGFSERDRAVKALGVEVHAVHDPVAAAHAIIDAANGQAASQSNQDGAVQHDGGNADSEATAAETTPHNAQPTEPDYD